MKGLSLGPLALLWVLLALLLLSVVRATEQEEEEATAQVEEQQAVEEGSGEKLVAPKSTLPALPPYLDGSDQNGEKLFFGPYSTTTYTVVSASTSTVFYSCLSGTKTDLCNGRRKRKAFSRLLDMPAQEAASLEGTLSEEYKAAEGSKDDNPPTDGKNKFAFTVWTTSKTTTSVTVVYTNSSSTVKLSYACLAGGLSLPAFSCG